MKYHLYDANKARVSTVVANDIDAATDLLLNDADFEHMDCISDHMTVITTPGGDECYVIEAGYETLMENHDA